MASSPLPYPLRCTDHKGIKTFMLIAPPTSQTSHTSPSTASKSVSPSVAFHHNCAFSITLHSAPGRISIAIPSTAAQVPGSDLQLPQGTPRQHLCSRQRFSHVAGPALHNYPVCPVCVPDAPLCRKHCLPRAKGPQTELALVHA